LSWLIVVLSLAAGCGKHEAEGGPDGGAGSEAVVSVRVARLEERRFADQVVAPGEWRSGGELVVSAPAAGVVEALTVAVGDRVEAGHPAGTLVPKGSWAALKGAELLVREAHDAASRADAEQALALARRDLVRVPVVVRQSGVVIRRSVEAGAEVPDGAEMLAVVPWATIVFEAHVPAADARRVRAGETAVVREPGSAPHNARVRRVLPATSGADQASLAWLAPEGGATPQLERFGTAEITVGTPHVGLAAPDSAIVEDDLTGQRRVAAVDSTGHLSWHAVVLGVSANGWHELVGAKLVPGTTVVIEGHRGLPEGTHVTVQP
jgi:multidrug efflux pump subunit AcrA (membrane-fusion protein)